MFAPLPRISVAPPPPIAVGIPPPFAVVPPPMGSRSQPLGAPYVEPPRNLHFFWAGNALPRTEMANLLAWGNQNFRGGRPCSLTLWSTLDTVGKLIGSNQYYQLKQVGIDIRTDSSNKIPYAIRPYFDEAARTWSWSLASDLARYGVLFDKGGAYIDVDIHPGTVDLSRGLPLIPVKGPPVFGPMLRNHHGWNAAIAALRSRGVSRPTNSDVISLLYAMSPVSANGFIVAHKGDSLFHSLYNRIQLNFGKHRHLVSYSGGRPVFLGRIPTNAAAFISGPYAISEILTVPMLKLTDPNWTQMIWVTEASAEARASPPPR
jgi:hypothetical protein